MKYITGKDRSQTCLFPLSLEDSISEENEVRLIDLFVESIDLKGFGFKVHFTENGRPAYHPKDLLKLFIYGYLNRVRSSRALEKETKRNIEVMWLLNSLAPDHNTIANFRRDNPKSIKKVFRSTVKVANHFDLIGKKLIAGDSMKLRAQNSKKNNFNQKKIDRHIAYIDHKLEGYNSQLAGADQDSQEELEKEKDKQEKRKGTYQKLEKGLKESGEKQVSTSDPESRQMIIRNNITEVAYNVQATVDAKNNLPIDYKVTNENDSKAMGNMVQRAKSILGTNSFTALYDKGYHTGSELYAAQRLGIKTMVAIPGISRSSQAPDPRYNVENFKYDPENDTYTCPEGKLLKTNNTWYKGSNYRFRQYRTKACKTCKAMHLCTKSAVNGKIVQRSEYTGCLEINKQNIVNEPHVYKKRQAIAEHPFGTIKRQWGFDHILSKNGMDRASADVGFMFIAYNIRRIINIIGTKGLREYLEDLVSLILRLNLVFGAFKRVLSQKILMTTKFINKIPVSPKLLKLAQKPEGSLGF